MNNRENDVDGRQRLAAIGVNQLLRFASGNLRQGNIGWAQGNMGGVLRIEQIVAGVVDMPLPLLINPQQNDVEARFVDGFHDIFR